MILQREFPLVSIVTVVYNAQNPIEKTIQSVLEQTYTNIEYIIIDGGSIDNTLSIIKKYEKQIKLWISEPDDGIYDAMNKGISLCQGSIVGIINAGDKYTVDAVATVVEAYHSQSNSPIVVGNCQEFQSLDNQHWMIISGCLDKLPYKMLPHPSVFVPLSIYEQIGIFKTSFKIAGDYEFLCRCYKESVPFVHLDKIISVASPRGFSNNYYLTEFEYFKARINNELSVSISLFLTLFSFVKITIHKILSKLGIWYFFEELRHGSYR